MGVRTMKRLLSRLMLILVAVIALGSCEKQSTGLKITYSSVSDANSWFIAFADEMDKEAKKRNYNFRVTHAQGKLVRQISDVEDIVAQKPDYPVLGPIDREGSAGRGYFAKKADIPVIVVNRDIVGVADEDYATKI